VIGSSVGTAEEMQELLQMALAGDVVANVEVFNFESINTVLQALAKSQIAGRVVLKLPQ
jgi:propanol-preferring alcohol dehydrogenase